MEVRDELESIGGGDDDEPESADPPAEETPPFDVDSGTETKPVENSSAEEPPAVEELPWRNAPMTFTMTPSSTRQSISLTPRLRSRKRTSYFPATKIKTGFICAL